MPAIYAHTRFGWEVIKELPEKVQLLCNKYKNVFDVGVNGPDIFFFYPFFMKNKVVKAGHRMHTQTGKIFIENGKKALISREDYEVKKVYLYGLACHFLLDSVCHPYVSEAMETYGVTHSAIETAFDRSLELLDGLELKHYNPGRQLYVSKREAEIIAQFYPGMDGKVVKKAVWGMAFCEKQFYNQNPVFRGTVAKLLYACDKRKNIYNMLMTKEENKACKESSQKLMELYEKALDMSKQFFGELEDFIEGKHPLGIDFDKTFEG